MIQLDEHIQPDARLRELRPTDIFVDTFPKVDNTVARAFVRRCCTYR